MGDGGWEDSRWRKGGKNKTNKTQTETMQRKDGWRREWVAGRWHQAVCAQTVRIHWHLQSGRSLFAVLPLEKFKRAEIHRKNAAPCGLTLPLTSLRGPLSSARGLQLSPCGIAVRLVLCSSPTCFSIFSNKKSPFPCGSKTVKLFSSLWQTGVGRGLQRIKFNTPNICAFFIFYGRSAFQNYIRMVKY